MVRHLRFLISLASLPLSQIDYLRARRICCSYDSLGIPGTIAWRVLGDTCPPFRQLHLTWAFVVGGLLRLRWAFLGAIDWHVSGLIWRAFLAQYESCIGGPCTHH